MAFNPDFTQTNDALSKAAWISMQGWLQKQGAKQSMDYLKESGRMWDEKAQADAAREQSRMSTQYDYSMAAAEREFFNWAAQQPEAKSILAQMEMKRLNGEDYTGLKSRLEDLYTQSGPNIEALTTKYDTSGKNIFSGLSMFDPGAIATLTEKAMTNRQADKDLGFKYDNLDFTVGKEKKDASDKNIARYLTKVEKLRSFYESIRKGEKATILVNGIPKKDSRESTAQEQAAIDKMLQQFGDIESKMIRDDPNDPWTEQDVEYLDKAWNYTENQVVLEEAATLWQTGKYKTFAEAEDMARANIQGMAGTATRKRGIGAPIDQELQTATEGEFTFAESTPSAIKKQLFDVFKAMKRQTTDEKGNQVLPDAQIWALILKENEELQRYLVKLKDIEDKPAENPMIKKPVEPKAEGLINWKKGQFEY